MNSATLVREILFCIVFLIVSVKSWAESSIPIIPSYLPNSCIVDANDPYEPNVKMDHGPLKGLCVIPVSRRSVKILEVQESRLYFPPAAGKVVVANFSHLNKFWIAQIPVQQVKNLILQIQYFPVLSFPKIDIAHTQFLFEFEEGAEILLLPQIKNPSAPSPIKLNRMIFSVENIGPYGELFDAFKGLKGHYNLAYRAVSLSDKYKWMVEEFGNVVEQKQVKLQAAQVRSVLLESLRRATEWSTRREYNTLRVNCVSEQFSILDQVLNIKGLPKPFIPNLAIQALWARDLLDMKVKIPSLNESYDGQP